MKSRANVASNRDNKKVVAIVTFIIVMMMIAAAVFFFNRNKSNEEELPERTWIIDDSDPADEIERIKKSARKSRPANGTYTEEFGALPNTSEAEADALLTQGALAEEAVGNLESKQYNVYNEDLDRQLAGPEQPQETVSPDEVQQLIKEVVEVIPQPTPTPEPATPTNPEIVVRPEPTPVPMPEPTVETEPTPAPAAVEEAVAETEPKPGSDTEKDAACASIQEGGYWDGTGCVFAVDPSDVTVE